MRNKILNYIKLHGCIKTIKWLLNNVKFRISKMKNKPIEFDYEQRTNNPALIYKTTVKVFIFATVAYYDIGGGQRSSQFAKTFNKLGYEVIYIYAFDSTESKRISIEIPTVLHKNIKHVRYEEIKDLMSENDIVIFEAPCSCFLEYVKLAAMKKANIVYENIDNWESSLGNNIYDENTLKTMLAYSSILSATSMLLKKQLEQYLSKYKIKKKEIFYLANAVDDELFNPVKQYDLPSDLILGKPTLLYYGSLWGKYFDWDLINNLAENNPDISINLIGDSANIQDKVTSSNIYFLGLKAQCELPAYLSYTDYAILPFKKDEIGDYVSPLKMFEYISMHKNILATDLDDIKNYPNVFTGNDYKSWQKKIKQNDEIDVKLADSFIQKNNWYNRAFTLLEELNLVDKYKCSDKYYDNISIIILNYNNDKVIFRAIDSLIKFNKRYNCEIIVVDNQSTDGSYEKLLLAYNKKIKILRNNKNGCSSGRNLGIKNSTKDYIMFLDSDQWVLHQYWLDIYLNLFDNLENVGAIAVNGGWFDSEGLSYRIVENYDYKYMPPKLQARCDIGYLATCGFLTTSKILKEVGMFDENYDPTCYEDTDLSLAIRNSGKEIYYSSCLAVGHLPHQTTKAGTDAHDKLILAKGKYFVQKWQKKNPKLLEYKK